MSLNIKNEHVHDLARRAAELTGKTQTGAIEEALEKLLASYGVDPVAARTARKMDAVHRITVEYAADPGRSDPEIRDVDDLYDASTGLPR